MGTTDAPAARPRSDLQVSIWLFLFFGVFVGGLWLLYLPADDRAGQMMLGVTSLFGLFVGGFLWVRRRELRRRDGEEAGPDDAAEEQYLPHSSVWPFLVGVAGFLVANGLLLGTWFLVPGVMVMVAGLVGFARQSLRRD